MTIPRKEHTNPQFEREIWENLNRKWKFEIDKSVSGTDNYISECLNGVSKIF